MKEPDADGGEIVLTLYLARHAEAHNPHGILYGRLPRVDLSATGRQQAAALGEAMAALPLVAIYQSPLLRARRTAEAIAAHHPGVPLVSSRLLLENRHPYQGRPHSEVAKLGDRAYDPEILGADGETIQNVRDRLVRFLHTLARRHRGQVVAAVAHADPIAALRAHLLEKELVSASLRQEAPPLAAVFRIDLKRDSSAELAWFWRPPAPPKQQQEGTTSGVATATNGGSAGEPADSSAGPEAAVSTGSSTSG
jgi:broad specificity phosphatase PhoE